MAKKTRTPMPPRARQQGPRRRESGPPLRPPRLDRRGLLSGIGLGVVVGIVILVVFLTRGGGGVSTAKVAKAMAAAGCTFKTYPSEGRGHVQSLSAKVTYKTFPPTSGTHYYIPAIWNRYGAPLNLVQEVHNLEHGGVIVQYGDKVPRSTVDQLTGFYDSSPNGMLLAPLPKLGDKIALTAWTRLAACAGFHRQAFANFRDAFRGKGPERFPVSSLTPGS